MLLNICLENIDNDECMPVLMGSTENPVFIHTGF